MLYFFGENIDIIYNIFFLVYCMFGYYYMVWFDIDGMCVCICFLYVYIEYIC